MLNTTTKNKRYTIIIISCFIVLSGYIAYRIKKDDFLHHTLKKVVAEKTDRLYKINYDSISVNEVAGNLFIKNLHVQADTIRQLEMIHTGDTNAAKLLMDIYIPVLEVIHFKTANALLSKQLECSEITVSNAKVTCYLFPGLKKPGDAKKQQQELYKQILGNFRLIKADSITVINNEVIAKDFYSKEVKFHTYNTSIHLSDVAIDSTYNMDTTRTFFCKEIKIQSQKVILGDKKKTAEISNATFDTKSKIVAISRFDYDDFKNGGFFKSTFAGISLHGISWTGPVENSDLNINAAIFEQGEIETHSTKGKKDTSTPTRRILNGWINKFSLGSLQLKSLNYTSRNADVKDKLFTLKNNSFSIKNIKIDRSSSLDETLVNKAEEIVLRNDEISLISPDKLYEYRLSGIKLNSLRKNIFIESARIIPRYNETDFSKQAHSQTDRFDVNMKNINCEGVDMTKLLKGEMDIRNVITSNNSIKDFRDLSYPNDTTSHHGPQMVYPHQMIHDISFKIKIKKFTATNTYIEYKEKNDRTHNSGRVRFSNTSIVINNISNNPIERTEKTTAFFSTTFLEKIPVAGSFTFFIYDWKKGKFTVSADVNKRFDATLFNELTQPMSLIKIEKGAIDFLQFKMTADTSSGEVSMILPYENMKISFLKKEGNEYRNKGIFSFLTNIIIKNNNKPTAGMRVANISVKHKRYSAFFKFIWSSMLSGIKDVSLLKL